MCGLCLELLGVAVLLHGGFSLLPARNDLPFVMIRPQTNGQMMMAAVKASAISTVLSWALVLTALCAMPLLGHFPDMERTLGFDLHCRTLIVLGLMLVTWRLIPVNLCFLWSGNRRLANLPVLLIVPICLGASVLASQSRNEEFWGYIMWFVPWLLAGLVAVKSLLACLAFRVSVKRGLLAPSALVGYLAIWTLLVAALMVPTLMLVHDKLGIITTSSLIILLTPLARIGFAPITLAWNRHA
jgi:hypothetical protein